MSFDEIVDEICDELNVADSETQIVIGRLVNQSYKRILATVGLQTSVRVAAVEGTLLVGDTAAVFEDMWKVTRVYLLDDDGNRIWPRERPWDELREQEPVEGTVSKWAVETVDNDSVTILVDAYNSEDELTIYADGYEVKTDLEDVDEPSFPAPYHTVIVEDVLRRQYRKRGKATEAKDCQAEYEKQLSEMRLWHAKTLAMDTRRKQTMRQPWQR